MKTILAVCLLPALAACISTPTEIGTVHEGVGAVRLAGDDVWKTAEIGSVVLEDDDVKTGPGESLVIDVEDTLLVLNENTRLTLGAAAPEGTRNLAYAAGDLFVVADAAGARPFRLSCEAGTVVVSSGVAVLRLEALAAPGDAKDGAAKAEHRLQVVLVRGAATAENLGLARALKPGDRVFVVSGTPPTVPEALPAAVMRDFEWALDEVLGRSQGGTWSQAPALGSPRAARRTSKGAGEGGRLVTPSGDGAEGEGDGGGEGAGEGPGDGGEGPGDFGPGDFAGGDE